MVKRIIRKTEPYAVQVPKDNSFGASQLNKQVRLVLGSLMKNCCKDRSGGAICGSVYEEITRDAQGRIVKSVCYPNRHERQIKQKKERKVA